MYTNYSEAGTTAVGEHSPSTSTSPWHWLHTNLAPPLDAANVKLRNVIPSKWHGTMSISYCELSRHQLATVDKPPLLFGAGGEVEENREGRPVGALGDARRAAVCGGAGGG